VIKILKTLFLTPLLFVQSCKLINLSKKNWKEFMGKRVTIVLENKVDDKLHKIQEEFIKEYKEPISFSKVLNEILHKGLL
jgi:uncharacterized protein YaaR (DUF327 family)